MQARREIFSCFLFAACRMLTAQALVAPISSNTAPRSQVIKDKVIAVTTRNHRFSLMAMATLCGRSIKALRSDLPRDVVNIRWRLGLYGSLGNQ